MGWWKDFWTKSPNQKDLEKQVKGLKRIVIEKDNLIDDLTAQLDMNEEKISRLNDKLDSFLIENSVDFIANARNKRENAKQFLDRK
jgi:peptidoglycan hydrolase CwlO-like protein